MTSHNDGENKWHATPNNRKMTTIIKTSVWAELNVNNYLIELHIHIACYDTKEKKSSDIHDNSLLSGLVQIDEWETK